MSPVTEGWLAAGHRRAALWLAVGAVLVAVFALAYSALAPDSYGATVRIRLATGGPDSIIRPGPLDPVLLAAQVSLLRSAQVALAAQERMRPFANAAAFREAAAALRRKVSVSTDRRTRELVLTVRTISAEQSAEIGNAYAAGYLQVLGAGAVNQTRTALRDAAARLAALPRRQARRRAALRAIARRLAPVVALKQVQIVRASSPRAAQLTRAAIASAIALMSLLVLLMAAGILRPRASAS